MSDDTRKRILLAAGPIFAEKGFEKTTVREICDAAKANIAAVNYHFRDKNTLYVEAVRAAHAARFEQVPPATINEDDPPAAQLRVFVQAMMSRLLAIEESPWQFQLMMHELWNPAGACETLVEDFIRPEFVALLSILDRLVPEHISGAERHRIAFSIVGQCLHYKFGKEVVRLLICEQEREAEFQLETLVDHITAFSLAAIAGLNANAVEQ